MIKLKRVSYIDELNQKVSLKCDNDFTKRSLESYRKYLIESGCSKVRFIYEEEE